MQYSYSPPVAERHKVEWDHHQHPGIYDPEPRKGFGSLKLHPDLATWLDAEAPGWTFRTDWDYSNAGDDDEGCHLLVPTQKAGEEFVARATAMSAAWTAADRAQMPIRIHLVGPEGETEVLRAHTIGNLHYFSNIIARLLPRELDHRYGIFVERDLHTIMHEMTKRGETTRTLALRLRPDEKVERLAKAYSIRVDIVTTAIPCGDTAPTLPGDSTSLQDV